MADILQIIGFTGTLLVAIAYLPQIIHLIKKRCTMGIDKGAWELWVIASILILIYAISTKESVFIALVSVNLLSTVIIFSLKMKYGENICGDHIIEYKLNKKLK